MGFDQFQKIMADFATDYLKPRFEAKQAGGELIRQTDKVFEDIFSGYTEITATLDALKLIEILISASPPRSKKLNKDEYIKFLVGNHLHEIYMLEQRFSAYGTKISRLYSHKVLPAAIKKIVYEPLKGIIDTRGAHVHTRRYSDDDLDSVSAMALFHRVGHQLGEDLDFQYKLAQVNWARKIKKNNADIMDMAEKYFALIASVIAEDGEIGFPSVRD